MQSNKRVGRRLNLVFVGAWPENIILIQRPAVKVNFTHGLLIGYVKSTSFDKQVCCLALEVSIDSKLGDDNNQGQSETSSI